MKEGVQMEDKHMKRHSAPLALRAVHIKTMLTYHEGAKRTARMGSGEAGSLIYCRWRG